jgi:hypothetical protein
MPDPPSDAAAPEIQAGPSDADAGPEVPRPAGKRPRATIEEVPDEDECFTQDFPAAFQAGAVFEKCKTEFEKLQAEQKTGGQAPWYPFESEEEWDLAQWLMTSGLSQSKTDDFLKLKKVRTNKLLHHPSAHKSKVREGMDPSFHNNRAFLQRIDALPRGPKWHLHPFQLVGDERDADGVQKKETVEMWYRDPLECIKELLANPAFKKLGFEPHRIFKEQNEDGEGVNREYNEMWTAEWWWNIQVG